MNALIEIKSISGIFTSMKEGEHGSEIYCL